MSTPESQALNAICEYLHMQGYFFFRINNTGIYDPVKGVHRSLPKWAMRGVADLFVLWKGQPFFLEVKSERGSQSPEQKVFQSLVEENDGDYFVVRSIDDVQRIFPRHA